MTSKKQPFADLHCHSTFSDGTLTPQELLKLAKKRGLRGLSITDHDTIQSYREALPLGEELGIKLISGAEFSSQHGGTTIHVLAYSFSLDDPNINSLCQQHIIRRRDRNLSILKKMEENGMRITEEELMEVAGKMATIGRPHIASIMVKKGYVKNLHEAFRNYLGDTKSFYVNGHYPTTEETIEVIHQSKGFAVLAHPHLLKNPLLFAELQNLPFDGLEAYYASFPASEEQPWLDEAKSQGWLVTGGSDFHGGDRSVNKLGVSWTPQETFELLHARFIENSV